MTFFVLVDAEISDAGPAVRPLMSAAIRRKRTNPESEVLFGFGKIRFGDDRIRPAGDIMPLVIIEASDTDLPSKQQVQKRLRRNAASHPGL